MKISASEPIRFRGIFYKNSLSMGECSQFGKKWTVNFFRGYIPESTSAVPLDYGTH